jgi:hypothetical protein
VVVEGGDVQLLVHVNVLGVFINFLVVLVLTFIMSLLLLKLVIFLFLIGVGDRVGFQVLVLWRTHTIIELVLSRGKLLVSATLVAANWLLMLLIIFYLGRAWNEFLLGLLIVHVIVEFFTAGLDVWLQGA